jgi:predicted O-methyltransferase YrrM
MFNLFRHFFAYLMYFIFARHKGGHGIHSPFLFRFLTHVVFTKKCNKDFKQVIAYHQSLKRLKIKIETGRLGAGSHSICTKSPTISSVATVSATRKKYGRLLTGLVDYFKPLNIIELGTSLGVGTCYLVLKKDPSCPLYTLEGSKCIYDYALANSPAFMEENTHALFGNFDEVLPAILHDLEAVGLVFIDGNHSKEATIAYFNLLLPKTNSQTVLVFDDIHWSAGMEEAWSYVKTHPMVKISLDLFQFGIVFFEKGLSKEDVIIRY